MALALPNFGQAERRKECQTIISITAERIPALRNLPDLSRLKEALMNRQIQTNFYGHFDDPELKRYMDSEYPTHPRGGNLPVGKHGNGGGSGGGDGEGDGSGAIVGGVCGGINGGVVGGSDGGVEGALLGAIIGIVLSAIFEGVYGGISGGDIGGDIGGDSGGGGELPMMPSHRRRPGHNRVRKSDGV